MRYLNATTAAVMSTRTFGTGHVIPIIAQSEHQQAIYAGVGGLDMPIVAGNGTVQVWSRKYTTNPDSTLIEVPGPIDRWTITTATPVTAPIVALANTLYAADPDARWAVVFAVKGATSITEIVDDTKSSLAYERDWYADDGLIRVATENLTVGVTLVPFVWGTSASGYGKDAARFVGRFLTGRDEAGNILPARTVVTPVYETTTVTFDHSLREWFGDSVKFAIIGPHRYERYSQAGRSAPLSYAPEMYSNAEMFSATVAEAPMGRTRQARQSLRNLSKTTEPGWAGRFVGHHGSLLAYLNGAPDGTDLVHPRKTLVNDGSPLFFAQTAQCISHALGLQSWTPPVIDQVSWATGGAYVEVGASAGVLTTTRRKRGNAAIAQSETFGGTVYPMTHRTEVAGFEVNGCPADRAEIVGGKIRIYPPASLGRNFAAHDRLRFGMGGATGSVNCAYDVIAELWQNWPILDVGLTGAYKSDGSVPDGIALEPATDFSIFANTLPPSEASVTVPTSTRFIDKVGVAGATATYENDRLGGSNVTSELVMEFKGTVAATQVGSSAYQLMGLAASSVNVAVRGASGNVDVTVKDSASTSLVAQTNIAMPVSMLGNTCTLRLVVDLSDAANGRVTLLQNGTVVKIWAGLVSTGSTLRTASLRCYYSDLTGTLEHFAAWRGLTGLTSDKAYVWIEGPAALANSHPWIDNGTVTDAAV